MNAIVYFFLAVISIGGAFYELVHKKSYSIIYIFSIALFVLLGCLRITQVRDLGDLGYYIDFYIYDNNAYFESGYIYFTTIIKMLFGRNPFVLVISVSFWVVLFLFLSSKICQRYAIAEKNSYLFSCEETSFYQSLFFFMMLYWGCFFTWETLRIGLATSILYCSGALYINGKKYLAIICSVLAVFFHTTCLIFVIGLTLLFWVTRIKRSFFILWFIGIIFVRIFFANILSVSSIISYVIASDSIFEHYELYDIDTTALGSFSLQDLMYHFFGLVMILGNLNNIKYNKSVILYYMGLFVGALFVGVSGSMRAQWLFYSMMIFVVYYFALDKHYSMKLKTTVIVIYAITQVVLTIRQFGYYL